jgi:transcriptional regulator with XRE-family HTH domain
MQPRKPLGEKVKEFRERKGWTTAQMAAAVGNDVKRQHIEQLEAAGDRMPRYIVALADAMGASLDDLLDRSPSKYTRAPADQRISTAVAVRAAMASRDRSDFGQRLHTARKAKGYTQTDVQQMLGLSQSTLSELETSALSSGRVVELAALYGVDPAWLATGEGDQAAGLAEDERRTIAQLRAIKAAHPENHLRIVEAIKAYAAGVQHADALLSENFNITDYTRALAAPNISIGAAVQAFGDLLQRIDGPRRRMVVGALHALLERPEDAQEVAALVVSLVGESGRG